MKRSGFRQQRSNFKGAGAYRHSTTLIPLTGLILVCNPGGQDIQQEGKPPHLLLMKGSPRISQRGANQASGTSRTWQQLCPKTDLPMAPWMLTNLSLV